MVMLGIQEPRIFTALIQVDEERSVRVTSEVPPSVERPVAVASVLLFLQTYQKHFHQLCPVNCYD